MYSTKFCCCIILILFLINYCLSKEDIYKEELYVRPLSTGHTYFNLLFTTVVSPDLLKSNISKFLKETLTLFNNDLFFLFIQYIIIIYFQK